MKIILLFIACVTAQAAILLPVRYDQATRNVAPTDLDFVGMSANFSTLQVNSVNVVDVARSLTLTGTAAEIDISAGAQDLSANRTWTLSLPTAMTFTGKTITGGSFTSITLTTPIVIGAIAFPDGIRQTFNPNATVPGLNVGIFAGDPSTPADGDIWYNSSTTTLRARINGATVSLSAGGGSGNVTAAAPFGTDRSLIVADGLTEGVQSVPAVTVDVSGNITTTGSMAAGGGGGVAGAFDLFEGTQPALVANTISFIAPVDVAVAGYSIEPLGTPTTGFVLRTVTGSRAVETSIAPGTGVTTALAAAVNGAAGLLTTDGTATPTGKTWDPAGTGNVLRQTKTLNLQRPDYGDGIGAVPQTNAFNVSGLMHYTFSGNAETNANYAVYEFDCPPDLDTAVAMTARFAFISKGSDADDYVFHITYSQVAPGTAYPTGTGIATSPIVITVTPTTPADGDLQASAATTLTGWAAALTPGRAMVVRIARLQNTQDNDARDVQLVISYGSTL